VKMDAIAYFMLLSEITIRRPDNSSKLSYQTRHTAICLFAFAWYATHLSHLWLICFTIIMLLNRVTVQFRLQNNEIMAAVMFVLTIALLGYGLQRSVVTLITAALYIFVWFLDIAIFTDLLKPDEEEEEEEDKKI
jgi:hypothetical protein